MVNKEALREIVPPQKAGSCLCAAAVDAATLVVSRSSFNARRAAKPTEGAQPVFPKVVGSGKHTCVR